MSSAQCKCGHAEFDHFGGGRCQRALTEEPVTWCPCVKFRAEDRDHIDEEPARRKVQRPPQTSPPGARKEILRWTVDVVDGGHMLYRIVQDQGPTTVGAHWLMQDRVLSNGAVVGEGSMCWIHKAVVDKLLALSPFTAQGASDTLVSAMNSESSSMEARIAAVERRIDNCTRLVGHGIMDRLSKMDAAADKNASELYQRLTVLEQAVQQLDQIVNPIHWRLSEVERQLDLQSKHLDEAVTSLAERLPQPDQFCVTTADGDRAMHNTPAPDSIVLQPLPPGEQVVQVVFASKVQQQLAFRQVGQGVEVVPGRLGIYTVSCVNPSTDTRTAYQFVVGVDELTSGGIRKWATLVHRFEGEGAREDPRLDQDVPLSDPDRT